MVLAAGRFGPPAQDTSKLVQMKSVAIYVRVSTDDQDCDRQIRDLTAYAGCAGYSIIGIFKETASGGKLDRRERAKVIALARARKIDAILVTELSRWSRDTTDLLHTLEELSSYGVSCIAQTGLQCDLTTPMGKLMVTMLAGFAEFERSILRERTRSGIAAARARGKKIGRQVGQAIRPHPLSENMLTMHRNGVSVRKIANQLKVSPTTVQKAIAKARA